MRKKLHFWRELRWQIYEPLSLAWATTLIHSVCCHIRNCTLSWKSSRGKSGEHVFFFFIFCFVLLFWNRVSLFSLGYPGSHFVVQDGLRFTETHLPLPSNAKKESIVSEHFLKLILGRNRKVVIQARDRETFWAIGQLGKEKRMSLTLF